MLVNGSLNLLYPLRGYNVIKKIDRPIDLKKSLFDNNRILGDSTTFAGIFVSLLVGALSGYIVYENFMIGLVVGASTYIGHALGSFTKRRLGIDDGKFLPIVDHGDYIFVNGLVFMFLNLIDYKIFLLSLIITLIIQPVFCYVGYRLKIRQNPL
jgi:CDP-2,3-bis-(O-geranylgeranyl)-sn-glycerol synthase